MAELAANPDSFAHDDDQLSASEMLSGGAVTIAATSSLEPEQTLDDPAVGGSPQQPPESIVEESDFDEVPRSVRDAQTRSRVCMKPGHMWLGGALLAAVAGVIGFVAGRATGG